MRIVYGQGVKRQNRGRKKGEKKKDNGALRLLLCLVLFLLMYIGKGIYPEQMAHNGQKLLNVIRSNVDLEAAMHTLGQSLSEDENLAEGVMEFCVQVFAPEKSRLTEWEEEPQPSKYMDPLPEAETGANVHDNMVQEDNDTDSVTQLEKEPEVGQVIGLVEQSDLSLQDGYEENVLYLGNIETVTPLPGRITSEFGYRDHPTIGRYSIHNGVDIGANSGDLIRAFAEGRVTEVGENGDYGKYLIIEHINGVTSFYAHCSKVLVSEEQQVKAGDGVALVGQTGQATGPHLHFEVLYNGVYLNPIHYIEAE